jgi:hypothetical protein
MRAADIVFVEVPPDIWDEGRSAWQANLDDLKRPRSDAEIEEEINVQGVRGTADEMEIRALAGSNVKAYASFDVPSAEYEKWDERVYYDAWKDNAEETFDETLVGVDVEANKTANLLVGRDSTMLGPTLDPETGAVTAGNFEHEMGLILKEHPELLDQDEIHALAPYGSGHGMLYYRAVATRVRVEWSEPHQNEPTPHSMELVFSHALGVSASRELLVNTFKESVISEGLYDGSFKPTEGMSTALGIKYIRDRTADLDEHDAVRLHESLRGKDSKQVRAIIDRVLTEKGLDPLARSTTEMQNYYERMRDNG